MNDKIKLLKTLWYERNPVHDFDENGEDRFWRTLLCVFNDYQESINKHTLVRIAQPLGMKQKLNDICVLAKAFIDEVDKKHPFISIPEDEALYIARHKLANNFKEQHKTKNNGF